MINFIKRRNRNIRSLLLACIVSYSLYYGFVATLRTPVFISGWTLLAISVFLMIFNTRKKLSTLPMVRASTWLQLHIYFGLFSGFLFLLHIQFRLPNGGFEVMLASIFSIVFLSGLFGLYVSRRFPKELNRKGENIIYERVPVIRKRIKDSVEDIVFRSIEETKSNTISNFYQEHLAKLFSQEYNIWRHFLSSDNYVYELKSKATVLRRYLNSEELLVLDEIMLHVTSKDELDFRYARQTVLKYWLFVHIPFTYSLVILMLLHLVLTYAYFGGIF